MARAAGGLFFLQEDLRERFSFFVSEASFGSAGMGDCSAGSGPAVMAAVATNMNDDRKDVERIMVQDA